MKNKLYILSLVVVAFSLLVGYVGWTAYAQRSNPARQTWEYKSIIIGRTFPQQRMGISRGGEFSSWAEASADGVKVLPAPVSMPSKAKELGDQGWELVSITPFSSVAGSESSSVTNGFSSSYAGFTTEIMYWFKRPKP